MTCGGLLLTSVSENVSILYTLVAFCVKIVSFLLVYANSLLTTLNSRESIRSGRDNGTDSLRMSRIVFEGSSSLGVDSSSTTRVCLA